MKTKKCWKCKEDFRENELIQYVSPGMKNFHNYCNKCYREQQDFDALKMKIISIFGSDQKLWPRIMKERKRLIEKYGYSDNIISDCLDYLYNVKKLKILSKSLCLVNPSNIEEMRKYKRQQAMLSGQITAAASVKIVEHSVSVQENTTKLQDSWNLEEWLE